MAEHLGAIDEIADAAAVGGMLRAGLSPRDAFVAAGWGEPGADGAPSDAAPSFAVAARLAHSSGAPLAPILDACSVAAREEAEAMIARQTALAGPRLSARVLLWLPAVGLGLAALVDAGVLAVLVTPLGLALLAVGGLLTLGGRWWMSRLVTGATTHPDAMVLALHAVRAAMAAGADVATALAAVSAALEPHDEALARSMREAALALAEGTPWSDCWGDETAEPLRRALRLPWERGAHAGPLLAAVADGVAIRHRHAAQVAAGELAVRLTLPLALCLLPAFVLVGIVPLLVTLVGGLR